MRKKILTLVLAGIKYSGDSIGDDIQIEIDAFGKFLRVDKIIKAGATAEINREIVKFETDQKLFKSGIRITVIEKDALFNDVGNIDNGIEIDASIAKLQKFVYKIEIKETRSILGKFWGNKIANEVSLPAYLKVKSEYIKHESMAKATYSISKKIFILNGKKYVAVDYENSPWQKGLYDIEIPDYPHPGGRNYTKIAPHSKVWFRVGHSGDRYIHAGSYSLGCMTIIEHNKWEEIFFALIKSRKGDFDSVGVLEMID